MLYNYMYLYIIVKSAYDIFVTDMRTERESWLSKNQSLELWKKLPTYTIILYDYDAVF